VEARFGTVAYALGIRLIPLMKNKTLLKYMIYEEMRYE